MHFDPREQAALRSAGLSTEELQRASERVGEAADEEAAALEAFFEAHATVYSDMDRAHSASDVTEHGAATLDTYTHGGDLRGWLRFETWGAYVEDGRTLEDGTVELTLGPTVHDRVRFAPTREAL